MGDRNHASVKWLCSQEKKEPTLRLTPKGLFSVLLGHDEALLGEFVDRLELYMRRNYNNQGEFGAIIFDGKKFIFESVTQKTHNNTRNVKEVKKCGR